MKNIIIFILLMLSYCSTYAQNTPFMTNEKPPCELRGFSIILYELKLDSTHTISQDNVLCYVDTSDAKCMEQLKGNTILPYGAREIPTDSVFFVDFRNFILKINDTYKDTNTLNTLEVYISENGKTNNYVFNDFRVFPILLNFLCPEIDINNIMYDDHDNYFISLLKQYSQSKNKLKLDFKR